MEFEPGVTVVVGPNGSGKSNVVDALAWVLGAQAPSAVRSNKMEDVIFNGTDKRPALGRAEVTLTFDNSSGLLPVEFTEVSITRTLFRNGDSEYAINGSPCRLLDVQELLSDAGVGRQQHVIVSQGQIDAVLNARPEDRRAIIEEAAGVLKYRKRKEKAERRLEGTEANLLRVQDLLREVRRQLRPLERQAEAARRHGDLVQELRALQLYLAGREVSSHRTRLTTLAQDRAQAEENDKNLRARLAQLDTEVLAAEAELTARGDSGLSDKLVRIEQLRERARGLNAIIAERRRSMERDRGQLMDTGLVATLEADSARLRSEIDAVEAELATIQPDTDQLVADETSFERERAALESGTIAAGPSTSAASAAAEVRGELRTLHSSRERDTEENRRLDVRATQLGDRLSSIENEIARLTAELAQFDAVEASLVDDFDRAQRRVVQAESQVEAATTARSDAHSAETRWTSRVDALQLALEGARAKAGVKALADVDGVIGTLLDVVVIDAGWEDAIEAALGEALAAVVVRDRSVARNALSKFRSGSMSGAVLALGVQPGTVRNDSVRQHVGARDGGDANAVNQLLDALLGQIVVAVDWSAALDVVAANPGVVVVTRDGDRFSASGWRIGTAGGGATAAALEEAIQRAQSASAELARADSDLAAARSELVDGKRELAELQGRLDAHDHRSDAARDSLARLNGERREVLAETESISNRRNDMVQGSVRQEQRIAELESLLIKLERDEAAEAEAARAISATRTEIESRAASLGSRRKDLEVRSAGLIERQQFLHRRLEETETRLNADAAARAEAAERRTKIEMGINAISRLAELVDGHRIAIEVEWQDLQEQRRRQSDEVRAAAQSLDESRKSRTATERQLEEQRERSRRLEIDEAEVKLRLEAAVESIRRDLEVEPEVAIASPLPELPEGVTPQAKTRELERELRLMGPINPLALEEFNELQQRHQFLEEQLEDVRETRRELSRVIKAVDLEIQTVFASAYADVSQNFTGLFSMLFPGGTGKLVLTNPDDLLNTGIEVEARPPGKNVKKLSLLSGGERSLTALAYLFAVFRSRPSPFYVMDEVEAALDDPNLHRFLQLVDEFRQEAQMIIVSHQKRTMEAGDSLLGVSMQPGGSSKVVTERAPRPQSASANN